MDTPQESIPMFGVPKNINKDFNSFQTDLIISEIDPGSSQIIAGSSQTIAGSSQTIAGSSQTTAGSSQIISQSSQTIAGSSLTFVGRSQTIVGSSQTNAEGSRTDTKSSRIIAGSSQKFAGISQTTAGSSQTDAESSRTIAGSSQTDAESSHKCNLCDRKFSTHKKYLNHIAIHVYDRENPLLGVFIKCSWCPNMFQSQIHIDRHITLEHRVEEKLLNRHICHICGKVFHAASTLRLHRISHNEATNYNCGLCPQSFSTPEMLARHKYKHAISKHMTVYKKHAQQTYLMLQGSKGYHLCAVCPQKFRTKDELTVHELTHTRENLFICEHCNMKFDKQSRLVNHRYLVHKNYHKQYQCTVCHERFSRKSHLDEHSRTHKLKVKGRYHCHPCGTAFAHKSDFRAHKRTHLDKIAIKCSKCSQFFYSEEGLEAHSAVHTMESLMSSLRVELADAFYGTKPKDGGFDELVSDFAKASLTASVDRDAPSTSGVIQLGSGNA